MSKKLLVIGGAGALGRGVVSHFTRASWRVTSVDFSVSEDASNNVLLPKSNSLKQAEQTLKEISSSNDKVNTIVCTAGGWAGGSIRDADSLFNLGEMYSKNLESAFLATYLASHLLVPGGLLILTGATAALQATPGMVSYGAIKAATHHLIASAVTELPGDSSVLGVLPTTIDTPMNRQFMGDADFSTWTKAEDIAEKILEWSNTPSAARPPSGHLVTATTVNNTTSWKDVGNSFQ
ncbi:short chain dehydrogenase [Phytophthora infestans]|uniref:Dihydropteridine reductase n=1 Tax=Phytophthora infestans TaxID=4787 RepID=A0A833THE1_PHYIN|nr:short chain dehydrogenase [Phytophthora infestans]KAF4139407.1 short chain dehydrogenase [Phytophthora infestans]